MNTSEATQVDSKAKVVAKRLTRRKFTFGRESPHEWRRNERAAYESRSHQRSYDGPHSDYFLIRVLDTIQKRGREFGDLTQPDDQYDHGTNAILREFGMTLKERDEAFSIYRKEVVKPSSRIAAEYVAKYGPTDIRRELPYLFEAVHILGVEAVRDMVLRDGKKPSEIIRSKAMDQLLGHISNNSMRVKVPTAPLEIIAGNTPLGQEYTSQPIYVGK